MLFEPPCDFSSRPPSSPPHYLIVAGPRTGATLLSYALGKHSQLAGAGEIFNNGEESSRTFLLQMLYGMSWTQAKSVQQEITDIPDLRPYLQHFTSRLNGFKLLYGQLDKASYLWEQLFYDWHDLKVIYLERDLADCVVSHYLTKVRGIYHKYQFERVDPPSPMEIPVSEVALYIKSFVWPKTQHQHILARFNHITLSYADTTERWDHACKRIENFLGVKVEKLPKILRKILPIAHTFVRNYDEIVRECR